MCCLIINIYICDYWIIKGLCFGGFFIFGFVYLFLRIDCFFCIVGCLVNLVIILVLKVLGGGVRFVWIE